MNINRITGSPRRIKLLPATKRLKQIIHDHGNIWKVLEPPRPMQCFDNQMGIRIQSMDGKHERNILVTHKDSEWSGDN